MIGRDGKAQKQSTGGKKHNKKVESSSAGLARGGGGIASQRGATHRPRGKGMEWLDCHRLVRF
jgi:hypothetical protein